LATYPSIGTAVAAVELLSALGQPYEIQLLDASFTENVTFNKAYASPNTLTLLPAPGVTSVITGTLTFGTNSTNTIVSGNNGTAAGNLTLKQTSILSPTVVFSGDASHNTISEAVVLGSAIGASSGVVVMAGDGISTGSDFNTLTLSSIGNASAIQLPVNLVYAANPSVVSRNDNFTLSYCKLFNFTGAGLLVAAGNGNQWTISNNSFYYNSVLAATTSQTAIDFRPGLTANQMLIDSNVIGGQAAGATGGVWTNSGTQSFRGIAVSCGTTASPDNNVSNNTISQISLVGVGSQSFTAMSMDAGRVVLAGNVVNNISNTGTGGSNSLVSTGNTIMSDANTVISSGQLMVISNGLTTFSGNLSNAGIINHTGGNMLINGSFTNSSTGVFSQTLGDLEIKGDMLNTGLFTCSTGTVRLTGPGAQLVSGGLYFNLEVNGGTTKTLTNDVEIYNGVQMISGLLATGPTYRIKLDPLANLAETETSYVLGQVDVTRTPTNGVLETFGGVGLAMQPAVASTLSGVTRVIRTTGTAPVGAGGHQGILRYYDISADLITGLDLNMTMSYFIHELNGIAPASLRFFKSTNGGVTWQVKGLSSAGTGLAVLNNVTGFSRWTLADINLPLPVGLTAFTAERSGANAVLSWTTASEQNNQGFGVEVSLDGQTFRELGFVAVQGTGSSTTPSSYRFVDTTPGKTGARYYRLRQQDRNRESAQYYGPRQLTFGLLSAPLLAYPTPFGPAGLTVSLGSAAAGALSLQLVDMLGRTVWTQTRPVAAGAASVAVVPVCGPGSYVLTATLNGQVQHQRVVRE